MTPYQGLIPGSEFENLNGFQEKKLKRMVRKWWFWKEYEYRLTLNHAPNRLTWVVRHCGQVIARMQPNENIISDYCSTPPWMHRFRPYSPKFLKRTGYFHDSGCQDHGMYFAENPLDPASKFEFREMGRMEVNCMLREMAEWEAFVIHKMPFSEAEALAESYYIAVDRFGPRW